MARYEVTMPNGIGYEIEAPDGANHNDLIATIASQFPESVNAPTPQKDATLGSALTGGAKSLVSGIQTLAGAATGDAEKAATEGLARSDQIGKETGNLGTLDDISQAYNKDGLLSAAGTTVGMIPGMVANTLPAMGAALGAGRLGAMAGGALGGPPGAILGGLGGALLGSALPQMGQNIEAQARTQQEQGKPVDVNVGAAVGGGLAQGALDVGGTAAILGRRLFGKVLGPAFETANDATKQAALLAAAQRSLTSSAARGAARGTLEIPTEVGQTIIERYQSGQSLTDDDAWEDYGNTALQAGLVGGTLGGVSGPVNRSSARGELEKAGLDFNTGKPPAPPIDLERQAALAKENGINIETVDREAAREAKLKVLSEPIDTERSLADLGTELSSLKSELAATKKPSPQLRGRIGRLEQAVADRRFVELGAASEPARRAAQNAADLKAQPPVLPARDAAQTFIKDQAASLDPVVVKQLRDQLTSKPPKARTPEEHLQLNAYNELLSEHRAQADALAKTERERNEELIRIAESGEQRVPNLAPDLQAAPKAVTFGLIDPIITKETLRATGIPLGAGYAKRLQGLDLSVPENRTAAAKVVAEAQQNPRVKPEVKEKLAALIERPEFNREGAAPLPEAVSGEIEAQVRAKRPVAAPTVEDVPLKFTPEAFDAMGVSKNALLRKNPEFAGLDASVPDQRAFMVKALEGFRDTKGRAPATVEKINRFIARMQQTPAQTERHQQAAKVARFGEYDPDVVFVRGNPQRPTTMEVDGVARPTLDSEGRAIHPTDEGVRNFWRWFGNSKTVDDKGRPIVFYHGTSKDADFSKFKLSKRGNWFTTDPATASMYARTNDSQNLKYDHLTGKYKHVNTAQRVMPVYIRVENPYTPTEQDLNDQRFSTNYARMQGALMERVRRAGHDGIDFGGGVWVTVGPEQIKSATGNTGAFSSSNASMAFLRNGAHVTDTPAFKAWFGDSKVVDADGKPLVVYHGTKNDFSRFSKVDGIFLTSNPRLAAQYAKGRGGNVMPVYVSLPDAEVFEYASDESPQDRYDFHRDIWINPNGNVIRNTKTGEVLVIAQHSVQIKSATGNNGAFDPTDANVAHVGSEAYKLAQDSGDVPGNVTPELSTALDAQDTKGALEAIRDAAFGYNEMETLIAKRFLDSGNRLPTIEMVDSLPATPEGDAPMGQYNAVTDTISLVRGQADSHTLLHEVTHSFVHRFITQQQANGFTSPHAKDLMDLYAHVKRMLPNSTEYGLSNVSEFASEAMSNRNFQMQLMGIPYRKQTAWGWLSRAVKRIMGITENDPVSNALMAAIIHVDGLMNRGRAAQIDQTGLPVINPIVNLAATARTGAGALTPADLEAIARAPSQEHRSVLKSFLGFFQQSAVGQPSIATKLRTLGVDQFASVAEKLGAVYDQGLRDSFGNINPMVFLRQAVDYGRVSVRFFMDGGLRKDAHGFYESYELKDEAGNPASVKAAIDQIKAFGEKYGMPFEDAKARVATLMEGMRLNNLRDANNQLEQLALAYEARNTPADDALADATRKKKKLLHMLNSEIDDLVNTFNKYPEVAAIRDTLNVTRGNAIDAMVSAGRITPETGEFWKENIDYVPFNRLKDIMEDTGLTQAGGRQGVAMLGRLPEFQGSLVRPVANTVDNTINTLSWMVGQAMRNDGTVRVVQAMEKAGYAKKIPDRAHVPQGKYLMPVVYEAGKPVNYVLDNEYDLAAFVQNADPQTATLDFMTGASRLLRASITAMPTFSLNQVLQDSSSRALVFSGTDNALKTAAKTLVNFPKTWLNAVMGKESTPSVELHRKGVVGNIDYNPVNPIDVLEHQTGATKYNAFEWTLNKLEQVAKASDQAAREAIYERTMLETGDAALAQVRAREFINFNRRGANKTMRTLTRVIPFFNSYVQGMDLLYRSATGIDASTGKSKGAAQRYFYGRMAMLTAIGFSYAAAMSGDEDYENADDFVRDRAWILPKAFSAAFDKGGVHTPLVIPVAKDLGFFFKTIPEHVIQFYNDQAKGENKAPWEAVKDLLQLAQADYIMEPIPAFLRPSLENLTNHSFFTGRELVPERMSKAPKPQQVNAGTSETARLLGEATDSSPILIDNFLKGTFGTAGGLALAAADSMLNRVGPAKGLQQVPGASAFTTHPEGMRITNEFYDLRTKITQAVIGAQLLENDPAALQRFVQDNKHLLAAKDWSEDKAQQLAEIRRARNIYQRNTEIGLSPLERRARINELDKVTKLILSDTRRMRKIVDNLGERT